MNKSWSAFINDLLFTKIENVLWVGCMSEQHGYKGLPKNRHLHEKKNKSLTGLSDFLTGLFDFLSGLLNFLTRVFDFLAVFFIFGLDYLNFDLVNNLNRAAFAMVPAAFPAFKASRAVFHHVCAPRKIYNIFHRVCCLPKMYNILHRICGLRKRKAFWWLMADVFVYLMCMNYDGTGKPHALISLSSGT